MVLVPKVGFDTFLDYHRMERKTHLIGSGHIALRDRPTAVDADLQAGLADIFQGRDGHATLARRQLAAGWVSAILAMGLLTDDRRAEDGDHAHVGIHLADNAVLVQRTDAIKHARL